ncbi:hypothetical protein DIPPA_50080 [Diplonema papillatum]|nr:hypothetical protein DIPPA_50080 [Diplonema papillatum]
MRARFVCRKCNQGCQVACDTEKTPLESQKDPIQSHVAPSKPCPDTGEALTVEQWRHRMLRFYAKYAPQLVPGRQLDQILRSWAGREDELWRNMIKRYGPEPDKDEAEQLLLSVLATQAPPSDMSFNSIETPGSKKDRRKPSVKESTPADTPSKSSSSADSKTRVPPAPLSAEVTIQLASEEKLGCQMKEIPDDQCIVVSEITENSAASRSKLAIHHRIHLCNNEPVQTLRGLGAVLQKRSSQDPAVKFVVSLYPKFLTCNACDSNTSTCIVPESSTTFSCTRCGTGGQGAVPPRQAASEKAAATCSADSLLSSSCRPCPETGESLTFQEWRLRMLRFYAKYAPERVHGRQLDQILRSWAGREDELWKFMRQRYGPEPPADEADRLLGDILASAAPPEENLPGIPEEEDSKMLRGSSRFRFGLSSFKRAPSSLPVSEDKSGDLANTSLTQKVFKSLTRLRKKSVSAEAADISTLDATNVESVSEYSACDASVESPREATAFRAASPVPLAL